MKVPTLLGTLGDRGCGPVLLVCAGKEMGSRTEQRAGNRGGDRTGCPDSPLHPFREKHLPIEARMWYGTPGNPARLSVALGTEPP